MNRAPALVALLVATGCGGGGEGPGATTTVDAGGLDAGGPDADQGVPIGLGATLLARDEEAFAAAVVPWGKRVAIASVRESGSSLLEVLDGDGVVTARWSLPVSIEALLPVDGGDLIVGAVNLATKRPWVGRMDPAGHLRWQNTYAGMNFAAVSGSLAPAPDGGFFFGYEDGLLRATGTGAVVWHLGDIAEGTTGVASGDTVYAALGNLAARISLAGAVVWTRAAQQDCQLQVNRVVLSGNGVIVVGTCGYPVDQDIYLAKLTKDGALEWQRRYGAADADEYLSDAIATEDGGILVLGNQFFFRDHPVILFRADGAGRILWQRRYPPPNGVDILSAHYTLTRDADGTITFGAGSATQTVVYRADAQGRLGACETAALAEDLPIEGPGAFLARDTTEVDWIDLGVPAATSGGRTSTSFAPLAVPAGAVTVAPLCR